VRLAASNRRHNALIAEVPVAGLALGLAACSSSSSVKPAGTEGQQTQVAINAFMKANPNIACQDRRPIARFHHLSISALSQLEHCFIAGATTPDVFEADGVAPGRGAGRVGRACPLR
jgi:hypothetical protein